MKFSKTIYAATAAALMGLAGVACTQDSPVTTWPDGEKPADKEPIAMERGTFAKGADVSWVTQFEQEGVKFYTPAGKEKELMWLLRDECGVNAIRLRVWVNPENDSEVNGWCNLDDVVIKAQRANDLGLRLMIDFHLSDRWADPGQQVIPAAWAGMDIDQATKAVAEHVDEVLSTLKARGIEPEWVQIGNETTPGMMHPLGHVDSNTTNDNFTRLINAGYDAVKAVLPEAKVLVHLDGGDNQWRYDLIFGKLAREGGKYDMIGMSLYPAADSWKETVDACMANVKHCVETYGRPVMICEIGFDRNLPEEAAKMMDYMYNKSRENDVKGIFWWEPETPHTHGYDKGCFDANNAPTATLDCFKQP